MILGRQLGFKMNNSSRMSSKFGMFETLYFTQNALILQHIMHPLGLSQNGFSISKNLFDNH